MGFTILVAIWGGKDVTEEAKKQYAATQTITVTRQHYGDPKENQVKFFHLVYHFGGIVGAVAMMENHGFQPEVPKLEVLAAYYGYTNITASIKSAIGKASSYSFVVKNNYNDPVSGICTIAYIRDGELKVLACKDGDTANLS